MVVNVDEIHALHVTFEFLSRNPRARVSQGQFYQHFT